LDAEFLHQVTELKRILLFWPEYPVGKLAGAFRRTAPLYNQGFSHPDFFWSVIP
jgi:hypothetical protein